MSGSSFVLSKNFEFAKELISYQQTKIENVNGYFRTEFIIPQGDILEGFYDLDKILDKEIWGVSLILDENEYHIKLPYFEPKLSSNVLMEIVKNGLKLFKMAYIERKIIFYTKDAPIEGKLYFCYVLFNDDHRQTWFDEHSDTTIIEFKEDNEFLKMKQQDKLREFSEWKISEIQLHLPNKY